MTQDDVRAKFLAALDRADVGVSDWEAGFLESCLGQFNFSPKQRIAIDKMRDKYDHKIGFNPDNSNRLAAKAAEEARRLPIGRHRFVARAGQPRPGFKKREEQHVVEVVRAKSHVLKLEWTPIVPGSVKVAGIPLDAWFIDLETGLIKAPFVRDGDKVEYDFYPNG